ncbi:MAG TPA: ABC transporter permease, partial [Dehalococcoidia bacterium]|nr:ABC transporter permease [Dehalococcoidia bacterium]
ILLAIFAPLIAPYGLDNRVIAERMQNPSMKHLLGTDELGRDILSRVIYGARVSAFVGFGSVLIATVIAAAIGMVSGFFGGKVDLIIQRLVDMWIAFPFLILLLAFMAVFGTPFGKAHLGPVTLEPSQQRAAQIIVILGLLFAIRDSRVVRGATMAIRNNTYVEAGRGLGASNLRILLSYILPNIAPPLLVLATLQLGTAILAESTLGFLGFGIPDPVPSWGHMLSGAARARVRIDPWLAFWPGLAISLSVFAFNMLGDALRDVLDPRLRGSR